MSYLIFGAGLLMGTFIGLQAWHHVYKVRMKALDSVLKTIAEHSALLDRRSKLLDERSELLNKRIGSSNLKLILTG